MDNIGLMEINEIRPFFTKAFYEIQKLKPAAGNNNPNNNDYDFDNYGNSSSMDARYGGGRGGSGLDNSNPYMADFDGKASYSSSTVPESSRRFQSTQDSRMN
jgi:GINS complex subunit 2